MKYMLVYDDEAHKLAVLAEDRAWSEPILHRWYWEIFTGSRSAAELYALGHELKSRYGHASGEYVYAHDPALPFAGAKTVFVTKDGARTQAYRMESVPVPPPKVRAGIETRWREGRWQKYLKTKGWVPS